MKLSALLTVAILLPASVFADARVLTRDFLLGKAALTAPLPTNEFIPPVESAPPAATLTGRLQLQRVSLLGAIRVHRDTFDVARTSQGAVGHLPPFDIELVQDGSAIIPVRRGHIPSKHPHWELIVEPGTAWRDPDDGGLSRAALPFALQERNANCVHNGMLTFLFDESTVSRVAYQITSETCAYFQADLWGVLPARFERRTPERAETVIADYRREVSARLPTRPMQSLALDFPGANPTRFGSREEIAPGDMTAFGFVIDGRHYVGGCETRYGPYPFCDVMDLPSYSLAKSLVAGLATLRLERLYPGTLQRKITAYVPACSDARRWADVTFEHALNMTTGNFTDPRPNVDEDAAATLDFFLAEDHATKIHLACNQHQRRVAPGTQWAYHTTDTYILGTALNALVKEKTGQGADFYDDVLARSLWQPLHLSPLMDSTRRTLDRRRQPFTGWGLVFHRGDIARIGRFLTSERGRLGNTPVFDERAFDAAMQRRADDVGFTTIDASFRYNKGFWAHDISGYIGCSRPVWVPYMSGFGGIHVVLFPNDTVYYYFSDGGTYRWSEAARESHRIRNLCETRE